MRIVVQHADTRVEKEFAVEAWYTIGHVKALVQASRAEFDCPAELQQLYQQLVPEYLEDERAPTSVTRPLRLRVRHEAAHAAAGSDAAVAGVTHLPRPMPTAVRSASMCSWSSQWCLRHWRWSRRGRN